jgi:hypothetical protein
MVKIVASDQEREILSIAKVIEELLAELGDWNFGGLIGTRSGYRYCAVKRSDLAFALSRLRSITFVAGD